MEINPRSRRSARVQAHQVGHLIRFVDLGEVNFTLFLHPTEALPFLRIRRRVPIADNDDVRIIVLMAVRKPLANRFAASVRCGIPPTPRGAMVALGGRPLRFQVNIHQFESETFTAGLAGERFKQEITSRYLSVPRNFFGTSFFASSSAEILSGTLFFEKPDVLDMAVPVG
jgi:hypothetical protein